MAFLLASLAQAGSSCSGASDWLITKCSTLFFIYEQQQHWKRMRVVAASIPPTVSSDDRT